MTSSSLRDIHTTRNGYSGKLFSAQYETRTTSVVSPADGDAPVSVFPSSVSLISDSAVQPENAYFCNLRVAG